MSPAIVALAAKRLFCPRRDKHHHQWRVEHRRNLNKYGYQYEYWLNEDQLFDGHILQSQANVKSTSKYGSKLSQLLIIHRIALLMLILSVTTFISVFRLVVYRFDNPTNSFGKDSFFTRANLTTFGVKSMIETSLTTTTIGDQHFNYLLEYGGLVLRKIYVVYFLGLLLVISYVCEKLFGCHIQLVHEDVLLQRQPPIVHQYCQHESMVSTDLKITLVQLLPLRLISRLWGYINQIPLPYYFRKPLFHWYSATFGCNLDELDAEDLTQYRNLSEFFRRSLKPNARVIDQSNGIASPSDGLIVQCEPLGPDGYVGNVKGIYYSAANFLGPNVVQMAGEKPKCLDQMMVDLKPGHKLYSCVVYLAPGDYHRFHSPVEWTVHSRRHFSGNLFSVKPSFVAKFKNLFTINERVVYFGKWKYGFFSMAAVGATNVGSVNVFCDPELQTNQAYFGANYRTEKHFHGNGVHFAKGQLFGEFNLGSTMVMIFEAPEDVQFESKVGDKIQFGKLLCSVQD